jgi:hypothetical protein
MIQYWGRWIEMYLVNGNFTLVAILQLPNMIDEFYNSLTHLPKISYYNYQ